MLCLAAALRADPVTASLPVFLASLNGGDAPTAVATTPRGRTMIAWRGDGIPAGPPPSVRYIVIDATGAIVTPVTSLALAPGVNPGRISAAATPVGFGLAWEETGGIDPAYRGIAIATFDLQGNLLSAPSVPANTLTALDEAQPSIAGTTDGSFAVSWVRLPVVSTSPSEGVYVRRFDGVGAAIDPFELRADDPLQSLGTQGHPAIGIFSTGEIVVAWHDGEPYALNGTSRDGDGRAVIGRWFDASMTPLTPSDAILNAFTIGDQSSPRCVCDSLGRVVIAWQDDQIIGSRINWRRFNGVTTPLMAAESSLAPYSAAPATFSSISGGQDGDFVIAWVPVLGGNPGGSGNLPAGFARFAPCGAFIDSQPVTPALPPGRIHTSLVVAMDAFGNVAAAWQGAIANNGDLFRRQYRRNRITTSPTGATPGTLVTITIDSPVCTSNSYQVGISGNQGTLAYGPRVIPLDPDPLFWTSIGPPVPPFSGLQGPLNLFGPTMTASVNVPAIPSLSGLTFWIAAALFQTGPPLEIQEITGAYPLTIQ